jgi:hypothetical protein
VFERVRSVLSGSTPVAEGLLLAERGILLLTSGLSSANVILVSAEGSLLLVEVVLLTMEVGLASMVSLLPFNDKFAMIFQRSCMIVISRRVRGRGNRWTSCVS